MYLTFHSYGQYILYPYGYKKQDAPTAKDVLEPLAKIGAKAAEEVNGRIYETGSAALKLNTAAAGGSDDWAYMKAGLKYSYTIELPPSAKNPGFELPEEEVEGVGKEAVEMIAAMIRGMK